MGELNEIDNLLASALGLARADQQREVAGRLAHAADLLAGRDPHGAAVLRAASAELLGELDDPRPLSVPVRPLPNDPPPPPDDAAELTRWRAWARTWVTYPQPPLRPEPVLADDMLRELAATRIAAPYDAQKRVRDDAHAAQRRAAAPHPNPAGVADDPGHPGGA